MRLKRVSESLIHQNQLAWPSTCEEWNQVLAQKHYKYPFTEPFCCYTSWKVTLVSSHSTHAANSSYVPVKREILVAVDDLNKTKFLVLGCSNLIIAVDHKPLQKVFDEWLLDEISNACLPNYKEKTACYQFHMAHFPVVYMRLPILFPTILLAQNNVSTEWHNSHRYFGFSAPLWTLCPLIYCLHELSLISSSLNPPVMNAWLHQLPQQWILLTVIMWNRL